MKHKGLVKIVLHDRVRAFGVKSVVLCIKPFPVGPALAIGRSYFGFQRINRILVKSEYIELRNYTYSKSNIEIVSQLPRLGFKFHLRKVSKRT